MSLKLKPLPPPFAGGAAVVDLFFGGVAGRLARSGGGALLYGPSIFCVGDRACGVTVALERKKSAGSSICFPLHTSK